jgi:hypothetical protein
VNKLDSWKRRTPWCCVQVHYRRGPVRVLHSKRLWSCETISSKTHTSCVYSSSGTLNWNHNSVNVTAVAVSMPPHSSSRRRKHIQGMWHLYEGQNLQNYAAWWLFCVVQQSLLQYSHHCEKSLWILCHGDLSFKL